jgi:hypothetical protein
MLCNWCHERIPEGEELKEKGGGAIERGSGYYEEGGIYHRECYYKKVKWDKRKLWIAIGIGILIILIFAFFIWWFTGREEKKWRRGNKVKVYRKGEWVWIDPEGKDGK